VSATTTASAPSAPIHAPSDGTVQDVAVAPSMWPAPKPRFTSSATRSSAVPLPHTMTSSDPATSASHPATRPSVNAAVAVETRRPKGTRGVWHRCLPPRSPVAAPLPAARRLRAVILSDVSIRKALAEGRIVIDPLMDGAVQPSSVDLRADRFFRVFRNDTTPYIDPKQPHEDLTELVEVAVGNAFILHPGEFVLGSTLERVALPDDLVARLEGKSSLGRLGLLIHSTAGFVDAGWDGHLTLELSNVANLPIAIYPEMKIGQISFLQMTTAAEHPYGSGQAGSKYQGQRGPTPSRFFRDFQS